MILRTSYKPYVNQIHVNQILKYFAKLELRDFFAQTLLCLNLSDTDT